MGILPQLVSERYGNALFEASLEGGFLEEINGQVVGLAKILADEPTYLKMLSSPVVDKQKKHDVIDKTLKASLHPFLYNFTLILVDNKRFADFSGITEVFVRLYDEHNNILRVTVISATTLSSGQLDKLKAKLEKKYDKKVILDNVIDETVVGGIKLKYNNTEVDGTVVSQLNAMKKQIKDSAV